MRTEIGSVHLKHILLSAISSIFRQFLLVCLLFVATPNFAQAVLVVDVDSDGVVNVATDLVYIARYVLGLSPVPPRFRTLDPTIPGNPEIAARIDVLGNWLDIDENGVVDVATDLIYISRHLFDLPPVPPSFRVIDPNILPDSVIGDNIDVLVTVDCGDGTVTAGFEECDGASDAACPGECQSGCRCGCPPLAAPVLDLHDTMTTETEVVVTGTAPADTTVRVTGPIGEFDVLVVNGSFSASVELAPTGLDRGNLVSFATVSECGSLSSPTVTTITHDTQPPTLFIDSPLDNAELIVPTVDVVGRVSDTLSGFMGLTVDVNGIGASVDEGIGTNGTFLASGVPVPLGVPTVLTATATDELGNQAVEEVTVVRTLPVLGLPIVEAVSGNGQMGVVGTVLGEPLLVQVVQSNGSPVPDVLVKFQVTRSDGRLTEDGLSEGVMELGVTTGQDGRASVFWQLGSDTGSGNNRVEATAVGAQGTVLFCASAETSGATQINVSSGNNQRGEVGATLVEALRVWVNDGRNQVADVPVTFTVVEGDGLVDGATATVVQTGPTGHAEVTFTLSPTAGAHSVEANFAGNPGLPAAFVANGIERDFDIPTSLRGLVLDNANRPIQGAECTLLVGAVGRFTVSDINGAFRFDNLPSSNDVDLLVDGLTAFHVGGAGGEDISPGSFPSLHFEPVLVPNAENTLPMPVLLPSLNPNNARIYDGTQDVEMTIEGIEGLRMTVRAGSMLRSDGSAPTPGDPQIIALNQVNFDDIPMPMPDGAAPPFAWTLQPSGATFDPPVEIEFPNVAGLPPGATMYFLSFDHDTMRFEIVTTGRVSDDGSVMKSDPGGGISTAGWGGFCPPYPNLATILGQILAGILNTIGPFIDPSFPWPNNTDGDTIDSTNADSEAASWEDFLAELLGDWAGPENVFQAGVDSVTGAWINSQLGGDPVILRTGELIHTETDLRIPGRGFPFEFQRTYRSQYNLNSSMGFNWDFKYNERLLPDPSDSQNIVRCSGRSRVDRYVGNLDGTFTSPDGFYDVLHENPDGTFTIRDLRGFKTHFDAGGLMTSQVDRNGNTMTFQYNSNGQPTVITDTLGRDIRLSYNTQGRLAVLTDFIGRQVLYSYDANGDLVAVRSPVVVGASTDNDFPEGKTTQYEYSSGFDDSEDERLAFLNHNLIAMTDPKGQRYLVNTYGENPESYDFDRVNVQQFGEPGQEFSFDYTELNAGQPITPTLPRNQTVETDRNGNRKVYIHNELGNLLEERVDTNRNVNPGDPTEFVTLHTYNEDGRRTSTMLPEGNQILFVIDDANPDRFQQGNLVEVIRLPGPRGGDQTQLRINLSYEPMFNQLRSKVDPRGNDPGFVPPNGGASSAARYTTTYFFDYQEGDSLAALAAELRSGEGEVATLLANAGVPLSLGDLNDDTLTDRTAGNVVRKEEPTVHLLVGSAQATVEGDTTQEIVTTYAYNSFGQVASETDPEGNVDEYLYYPETDPDGDGILSNSSRPLTSPTGGYRQAVVRDNANSPRRRSTAALTQIRTEALYDPVGNIIRTIDGRGNPTSYEVNALNQIVRVTSEPPFNYERSYVYDANNNVVRAEIQNVGTNGPDLDESVTLTYQYDVLDNRTQSTREASTTNILVTQYEYDANENPTRLIQPEGNVIERVYDERDLMFSRTRGAGSPEASTVTMTYDGNRKLARAVDAMDNNGDGQNEETLFFYDGFDRRNRVADAVGNDLLHNFDPADNLVREHRSGTNGGPSPTDSSGTGNVLLSETEMLHDELSREFQRDDVLFSNIASVGPEGQLSPSDGKVTVRYEYDRANRRTRLLDDNIHDHRIDYDGVDRAILETDALGNTVASTYDDNRNLTETLETETSPEGLLPDEEFLKRFDYDSIDRVIAVTDNLGNQTHFAYDSRDNLVGTVDALGNTTTLVLDGIDRKLSDTKDLRTGGIGSGAIDTSNPVNADGQILELYDWDGNSRLRSVTDDNGNTTTYGYDALSRRTLETYADATTIAYTYDRDDNVVTATDQNGSVISNTYDGINRLTARDVARATGVEGTTQWRFEYDGLSRRTRVTDNNDPGAGADDSVVELQYDSLSRLLVEIQNAKQVETVYDGVGNRLSCTYPGGRVVEATYDELDRIDAIQNQGDPETIAEYDYLGPGRVLERRYGNETRLRYHDGAGNDIGYDGLKRRILHRHETNSGNLIAGFQHAFDKEHNRRFELDLIRDEADIFEYDSVYRLTRAGSALPGASVVGITNNETANSDVSALTGTPEMTYRFDGVGNWTLKTTDGATTAFTPNEMNEYASVGGGANAHDDNGNLSSDGDHEYFHDAANRLVRVADVGGDIATYAYDGLGRRIEKEAGPDETAYFYDRARVIEERDGADTMLRQYVFGQGIDEVLELATGGQAYFYGDNFLGSVIAITDEAGSVVERYRYGVYGDLTILDGDGSNQIPVSNVANSFGFTGRRFDDETALYYYRARYYAPANGRFIERDPLGYSGGMGLFEYAQSNPTNRTDPLGLLTKTGEGTLADIAEAIAEGVVSNAAEVLVRPMKPFGKPLVKNPGLRSPWAKPSIGFYGVMTEFLGYAATVAEVLSRLDPDELYTVTESLKVITDDEGPGYCYGCAGESYEAQLLRETLSSFEE